MSMNPKLHLTPISLGGVGVREKWNYLGARVALGYGPQVEGKRCSWFPRENIGTGGTTLIIPVADFWPAGQRCDSSPA